MRARVCGLMFFFLYTVGGGRGVSGADEGPPRRFLFSDHRRNAVAIADERGNLEWEYKGQHPQDVWMLTNGTVLVAWMGAAEIIQPDIQKKTGGQVLWAFKIQEPGDEIPVAQPIEGERILIGICKKKTAGELVEVDRKGVVAKKLLTPVQARGHSQFRFCRKTRNGTYLIPALADGKVYEVDGEGKVLWILPLPQACAALRLDNGNTLVHGEKAIREYDNEYKLVWEAQAKELGWSARILAGLNRFSDGTVLSVNWGASGLDEAGSHFILLNHEKKILWRLFGNPQVKCAAHVQLLGLDVPVLR